MDCFLGLTEVSYEIPIVFLYYGGRTFISIEGKFKKFNKQKGYEVITYVPMYQSRDYSHYISCPLTLSCPEEL